MVAILSRRRGFTVAEVLLAILLIAVSLLTLLGLSLRTLQANRKTIDTGSGQMVAEQLIEEIAHSAEISKTAPVWAVNSAVVAYSTDVVVIQGTPFEATTYAVDVVASSPPLFAATKRLKKLTTEVIWKDLAQGKMGYGQLHARASRLVNEP